MGVSKLFFYLALLFSTHMQALPQKVEVWFLKSGPLESSVQRLEKKTRIIPKSVQIAFNESLQKRQCQKMGEYCFDPQFGLYKKETGVNEADYTKIHDYEFFDKGAITRKNEVAKGTCDKDNIFDLYCSREKKAKKAAINKFEIWIDTSSTMKQVDYDGYDKSCFREKFIRKISQTCDFNQNFKVYTYKEYKKELGAFDLACLNSGLNSTKNLIRDIKLSEAKHLIIITDIFEASSELVDFVESLSDGSVKGLKKPLYASELLKEASRFKNVCL